MHVHAWGRHGSDLQARVDVVQQNCLDVATELGLELREGHLPDLNVVNCFTGNLLCASRNSISALFIYAKPTEADLLWKPDQLDLELVSYGHGRLFCLAKELLHPLLNCSTAHSQVCLSSLAACGPLEVCRMLHEQSVQPLCSSSSKLCAAPSKSLGCSSSVGSSVGSSGMSSRITS